MKQYKDPFPVELFESPIIKTSIDFQLYQWQHGGGGFMMGFLSSWCQHRRRPTHVNTHPLGAATQNIHVTQY